MVSELVRELAALTWRILPYFFAGIVGAAALMAFVPERWVQSSFGRQRRGSLAYAVTAGAVLPGCSCTTMPMAAGLRATGGPRLGTVAAFIFVSPLLSPITVTLTWALLGWELTIARVLASLIGSFLLGWTVNRWEPFFAKAELAPIAGGAELETDKECCEVEVGSSDGPARRFALALSQTLRSIGPHFLIGMVAAAALSALLPESAIPRFLGGSSGVGAYAVAALIGIPLYVCEGEEVPITFALLGHGLGSGPALTFLLGSVGTCVPTMIMSRKIVGQR
ncbi:MAG: permease, partial [Candidatus Limnocylindria bacterium]